jgi:hypothetical protein
MGVVPINLPFWDDSNWKELEASFSMYGSLTKSVEYAVRELPEGLLEGVGSSYKESGYQYLFYALVKLLSPEKICEIGVLQGFSLLSMASALKENNQGEILGYDLFDDYEFKNERMNNVQSRIDKTGLSEFANIKKQDAFSVSSEVEKTDILHVDISNNGNTVEQLFLEWNEKVNKMMIFEGGGHARDQIDWMVKFQKPAISPVLCQLSDQFQNWLFVTLEAYPSITIIFKHDAFKF